MTLIRGEGKPSSVPYYRHPCADAQHLKIFSKPKEMLKSNREKSQSLDCLLSAWIDLYSRNQSFLVEGIQRLIVNAEVSSAAVYALSIIVNALINVKGIGSGHALFFVRNKLLTLYSRHFKNRINRALNLNFLIVNETVVKCFDVWCQILSKVAFV
ncbi:hypothetical protein Anas_08173 [Armadillidium nasatum]|uniref:Uncharacterized protein n=1 Tax=Armadillidium nasatum TaxID=96803 RepID=A0A5N5TKZ2_9CRUS|nr:hypothetical protein Anas_08173 [Armadillidium nasatum]